jgi:putative membrane protein (TIGR04086 family)
MTTVRTKRVIICVTSSPPTERLPIASCCHIRILTEASPWHTECGGAIVGIRQGVLFHAAGPYNGDSLAVYDSVEEESCMESTGRTGTASPVLSGLIYAFLILGAAALLISIVLALTSQTERSLPAYAYAIHTISIWIGGLVAGRRAGTKGWYAGGITGALYSIIVFIVGFLSFGKGTDLLSLALSAAAFVIGAAGGILGVNTRKR